MFLSKGETLATFACSGNFPFNMLLLIALDNGLLKISADNSTKLGGILSIHIDFFGIFSLTVFSHVLRKQMLEFYFLQVEQILLSSS